MSTKKISFNLKLISNKDELKKKNMLCKSKTLGANVKLKNIIPKNLNIQNCFKTMRLERSNRGILDIEKCKSLFRTFNNFYSYISLNNDEDETDHLLSEVAWSIFHKKCKKNTLIKKSGEKNEFFYLLMTGKIQKVSIVFKKEKVTLEEYLLYLLKMNLIKENELLKKCRQINKSIMNINYNNIESFCEKNPKYNYSDLLKRATDEIINMGFDLKRINHNDEYEIPSIQNYLDVGEIKKDIKSSVNKGPTIYLYIPKYELSSTITKGEFFGFLNKEELSEYSSYICLEDCDLGYINKNNIVESTIFEQIDLTISKYFSKNKNKYYIFKDIDDKIFNHKYSIFMNYKKYKQGDKIFLQGSLNEGIYVIKDGEIKINTYSKANDLTKLMLKLIWSLKGFQEHVPSSEFKNIIKDNEDNDNNSKNDNSNIYEENLKYIDFGNLKEGDILGLNELYDYNTLVYNFSAECVSKEANLFFINKNNFNLMLSKEKSLYASVIQKVELRIKLMIGTIKNFKRYLTAETGFKHKPKNEKVKIKNNNINDINDKKPIIVKDLKQNFINNSILWNKNESINTNEGLQCSISSIKKKQRNKSTAYFNTINNSNLPNIREKLIESQDKVKYNKIFNKNKRYNNLNLNNNLYPTNILKLLSVQKPNYYENCMKESKLMKNNTYNSLINKKSFKSNYQLYNNTTPNKYLIKNNNISIFNNTMENRKDILPFLGKDLTKGNYKNNQYFKTLPFPS